MPLRASTISWYWQLMVCLQGAYCISKQHKMHEVKHLSPAVVLTFSWLVTCFQVFRTIDNLYLTLRGFWSFQTFFSFKTFKIFAGEMYWIILTCLIT